jgi:hypothetical protein
MLKDLPEKKMSCRVLAPLERIQVSIVQIKNHRLPFSSKIEQPLPGSAPIPGKPSYASASARKEKS